MTEILQRFPDSVGNSSDCMPMTAAYETESLNV